MTLVYGIEVSTVECDKEIAAREVKPGAFTDFLGWIGLQGWKFCIWGDRRESYAPAQDRLVMRLIPDPPDGGSQELGDWMEECQEIGLTLCKHLESNYATLLAEMQSTKEGRRELASGFYMISMHPLYQSAGWFPVNISVEDLLAAYFKIDLAASSRERDEILAALRKVQGL